MPEKYGPQIYVVIEFAHRGSTFNLIFWSADLALIRDWIDKNHNSDTYFEYYEVKQLIEF
jgi:hypothetical protein